MATKVIIVHGWDAAPDSNWFPWLKSNLEEDQIECIVPMMPNSALPKLEEWVSHLKKIIESQAVSPESRIILIGHSLGCITIAHYLARLQSKPVHGCIFVAGFSGNIRITAIKEFYETAVDLRKAKEKTGKSISIISLDDRAVPAEKSREFARALGSEIVEVNGYGHFTGSEGVRKLPMILPEIQKLL